MLVPAVVATIIGAGWLAQSRRTPKEITPEMAANYRHIYCQAMTGKDISAKMLREMSKEFRQRGMKAEADMLIRRAELAEAPSELKAARRESLKKLLACTDIELIRHAADVHESMGAFGACHALREYANGLEAIANTPAAPVEVGNVDEQS